MTRPQELVLRPVDGLARWLPPALFRLAFRAISMVEQRPEHRTANLSPEDGFFRRDRHVQPRLDAQSWRLSIAGVPTPGELDLRQLDALPQSEQVCVMECAGNGNHWQGSAGLIGQVHWRGPLVTDVIDACGGPGDKRHFVFRGCDGLFSRSRGYHYGLSLDELRRSKAIIATRFNGAPLSRARGFPARLVAPGIYSMSYVKWLSSIQGLAAHHDGLYNRRVYTNKRRVGNRWEREEARWIGLKSLIVACSRRGDDWELSGRAWGGQSAVGGVEVSTDGGRSWQPGQLEPVSGFPGAETDMGHAWAGFRFLWRAPAPGRYRVGCRAIAVDGSQQPLEPPADRVGHFDQTRVKWRRVQVPARATPTASASSPPTPTRPGP